MKFAINIEAFRKYYEDVISCRNALNANADMLNSNGENAIEALIPIVDNYGREMVKKLIANAVLQDSRNYSEQVRRWADNAVISMFIYETDNVLVDYIPDYLSETAIEMIALDLMEREKNKEVVTSKEGTEFEVVCHDKYTCLLGFRRDGMTLYANHNIIPSRIEEIPFSDRDIQNIGFSYIDAHKEYIEIVVANERTDKAADVLEQQYNDFKNEMLSKSPQDIFDECYRISAVEDVYFYLTENAMLTETQENYIINSGENVLMDMAMDWYEYGNYTEELGDHINDSWHEKISESEIFDENADEEELE